MACVVMGGEEEPCVPPHFMAAIEESTGYPCPRREWPDRDGPTLMQLVFLGKPQEMSPQGHLYLTHFWAAFGDATPEDRLRAHNMVLAAYTDSVVRLALWPEQG